MYHKSRHAEYEVICLTHAITESKLQTKFHYAIWSQTGPRLVAQTCRRPSSSLRQWRRRLNDDCVETKHDKSVPRLGASVERWVGHRIPACFPRPRPCAGRLQAAGGRASTDPAACRRSPSACGCRSEPSAAQRSHKHHTPSLYSTLVWIHNDHQLLAVLCSGMPVKVENQPVQRRKHWQNIVQQRIKHHETRRQLFVFKDTPSWSPTVSLQSWSRSWTDGLCSRSVVRFPIVGKLWKLSFARHF